MVVLLSYSLFPLFPAVALAAVNCHSTHITSPSAPGAQILSISANPVEDYIVPVTIPALPPISFCNVTVAYTHPG